MTASDSRSVDAKRILTPSGERRILIGFAVAIVITCVLATASFLSISRLRDDGASVARIQEIFRLLETVMGDMSQAESAVRGFSITGDASFLLPYETASRDSDALLESVSRLIDDPSQASRMPQLSVLVKQRFGVFNEVADAGRRKDFVAVKQIIASGRSKSLRDALRRHIDEMQSAEEVLLKKRLEGTHKRARFTLAILALGSLLSIGVAIVAAYLIRREFAGSRQAHAALLAANEFLDLRVEERTAELRRANENLVLAYLDLEEKALAAETANRAKSAFLTTMSHELRTPLNIIIGFTGTLLMRLPGPLTLDQVKHLGNIKSSARHLLSLIDDILDISKIEAGKFDLAPAAFDPRQVLDETAALFADTAQSKGLQVAVAWRGPEGQRYWADSIRLRQMLSNLVNNAIKFTGQGIVRVEAFEVERKENESVLEFSVTDSGIGIPQDKQHLLFQPFFQVDSSTSRAYGGSGLGLSIVRSLAHLMGGEVGVESEAGKGSRFWFHIRAGIPSVET